MKLKMKKLIFVVIALIFVWSMTASAFAQTSETTIDFAKKGSISITLRDSSSKQVVKGAGLRIYKIADAKNAGGNLGFEFTESFKNSGVSLDDINNAYLAEHLANYAANERATGTDGTASGESIRFDNLDLGLYLVVQTGSVNGYYPISPFLVSVPMTGENGRLWIYDVEASPKVSIRPWTPTPPGKPDEPGKPEEPEKPEKPEQPSEDKTTLKVVKKWDTDGKANPESVSIVLLRDGQIYEKIRLNNDNNWSYTWKDLDAKYKWTAVENTVPKGFTASYKEKGTVVTITNKANPELVSKKHNITVRKVWDDSGKNRPSSITVTLYRDGKSFDEKVLSSDNNWRCTWKNLDKDSKWDVKETKVPKGYTAKYQRNGDYFVITNANLLIQTGQLIWPIPILAVLGLLAFSAGWIIKYGSHRKYNTRKKQMHDAED